MKMNKINPSKMLLSSLGLSFSLLAGCGGEGEVEEGQPVGLKVSVAGAGQINTLSGAILCGQGATDCAESYEEVTEETFTAVPEVGYYFAGWQVAQCAGVAAECQLEISSSLNGVSSDTFELKANFEPIEAAPEEAAYTYDAFGRRSSKTLGGVTTFFIYDTQGKLIQELDGSGKPVKEHIYLDEEQVAAVSRIGSSTAMQTLFVHNDHLATPIMMTNSSREVVWEIETAPFGETYALYDAENLNKRFPGQYFDRESGLNYNHHRYYNPYTGRYMESDPIGLLGGANTYAYALGNPLINTDPDGLWVTPQTVGGALGFIVGFGYSWYVNENSLSTALFDGLQAGAAGFVSGGGSVYTGFIASASAAAIRSKIDCGEIDVLNSGVNGLFAVAGGGFGKVGGAFVPQRLVREQRGFFGRYAEKLDLLGPKMVDRNIALRTNVSAATAAVSENSMAGAYSGSSWGGCPCTR